MTVASFIGAGAIPATGLGKAPGAAHGAGRDGAAAFELLSSTVFAATSFRANWQSLLVSLNSSMEGFGQAEANQETAPTASASGQTPDKSTLSTLATGIGLRQGQGTDKGSAETGAGANLSPADARTKASVAQLAVGSAKPASTIVEEKILARSPETESAHSSRPSRSINTTEADTAPAGPLPGLVAAAIASLSQAVPAVAITTPAAHSTDEKAQPAQINISADLSTEKSVALASIVSQSPESVAPRENATAVNTTVPLTTEVSELPTQQRQASPIPSQSGSSSITIDETVVSVPNKDAPPPVAMLAESVNSPETPIPASSLAQQTGLASARNADTAETLVTNQTPSLAPAPEQSRTLPFVQDHSPIQIAAPSLNPEEVVAPDQSTPLIFVSSQSLTQTSAPSQNTSQAPSQTPTPIQNPIPAEVASHNLTQITTSNTNQTETFAVSQAPSQTLVSSQYQAPSFVQSHLQVATHPEKQGVNVIAAPMPGDGLNPLPVAASFAASQSTQLAALPSVLSKPASTSGGKVSTHESVRSARGAGNFDSVQQVNYVITGQSSGQAVDASSTARTLTGAGGIVNTAGELAGATSAAPARQDSREAFATLDAAGAPGAPAWIHAGAQRAEAGYQDPAMGWVGVRADLSGGGVHAQLVPGSADAAQALGSHLAGLNAYLAEHHTPVETLTLTAPEGGWSGLGSSRGAGEGMQQGAGQQTPQGADASSPSGSYPEAVVQSPAASAELPAFFGNMDGSAQAAHMGGFHISVMA